MLGSFSHLYHKMRDWGQPDRSSSRIQLLQTVNKEATRTTSPSLLLPRLEARSPPLPTVPADPGLSHTRQSSHCKVPGNVVFSQLSTTQETSSLNQSQMAAGTRVFLIACPTQLLNQHKYLGCSLFSAKPSHIQGRFSRSLTSLAMQSQVEHLNMKSQATSLEKLKSLSCKTWTQANIWFLELMSQRKHQNRR